MWAQIAPIVKAKLDEEMKGLSAGCAFDPLTKLEGVTVGGKTGDDKNVVIVLKGFTKDEITSCGAALAKKDGKTFEVSEADGLTLIKTDGKDLHVAWMDPTTAVISPNPDTAWVKARAAGQGGLDGNAAFKALAGKVNTATSMWFVAMPTAGSDLDLSKSMPGAQGLYGSIQLTDGLAIDGGLKFDTPDNAQKAHAMVSGGMAQAKAALPAIATVVDKAQLAMAGADLTLKLALSGQDLASLGAGLGPMLAPMMGGMGK
jgi:hypothetical protein